MELPGKRIAKWREHKGLSVRQLSDLADIPYSTLKTIESNENAEKGKPSFEVLAKLRKTFPDLNIDWILDENEPMLRDGRTLSKAESFLPGGELTVFGATVLPKGGLGRALPNFALDESNEKLQTPKQAPAPTPTNAKEFIEALIKESDEVKALLRDSNQEREKLHNIIKEQQGTVRFLQEQVTNLSAQLQSAGKQDGNHYNDAPGDLTIAAEPIQPIGFKVRMMYPDGLPDVVVGTSMRIAA